MEVVVGGDVPSTHAYQLGRDRVHVRDFPVSVHRGLRVKLKVTTHSTGLGVLVILLSSCIVRLEDAPGSREIEDGNDKIDLLQVACTIKISET